VPVHVPRAGGYNWVDCYVDNAARVLLGASYASNNMTVDNCAAFCNVQSWQMMGIEYASQCFCGNVTNSAGSQASTTDCNMLCSGNKVSSSLALSILVLRNCPSANG
jgi:iron transport multicopper oxidase